MFAKRAFADQSTQPAGCALLLDLQSEKMLFERGVVEAAEWVTPPGSTVKPLSLWALLRSGKLKLDEAMICPRQLRLAGLRMDCSHPLLPFPVDASSAITYSCNCAVAHFASRFRIGELAKFYQEVGFSSETRLVPGAQNTGYATNSVSGDQLQLQALGERNVRVTALEIMESYRRLASLAHVPNFAPILEGLEGAVEFGTGRMAQLSGCTVAGKTGSVRTTEGLHVAWFAGFAPSRDPRLLVTILTQGRSGAQSAAPIAGLLLRRYL